MPRPVIATVGLGSNLGDKCANIARAISLLTDGGEIRLVKRSRDYRSAPWGGIAQDWFVNACIAVETSLAPHELLKRCQKIEHEVGRVRGQKWGPRLIDIDVLTYGDETIDTPDLSVPHPLIAERMFVLRPLQEIVPHLVLDGAPIASLIAKADPGGVEPMDEPPSTGRTPSR